MKQKVTYITTPLYYVNAKPHIGHAYTNILCDTFSRYYKLCGREVFFLTGTDEHGTKIEKVAKENGEQPRAYVDRMVPHFKELWKLLGINYDYFIRTTDEPHKRVVHNILNKLEANGDIYKSRYKGWYSVQDETFYTETQIREGFDAGVGRDLIEIEEENYFFKLSKYQEWLIEYIEKHPDFIRPEMRRNEILSFLKEPLEDLCITRPRSRLEWGIEYPNSKDHVIYVWFDALINYVSAIGLTTDEKKFSAHWPADAHFVGKDILRHHAVYWPIMLHACGVEMPKTIVAHGWWTVQGAKVSKSVGNIVDPTELEKIYGVDPVRYFLLREVKLGYDGAYSEDLLRERYTTDLANDLGNLFFRIASMLDKYFKAAIPEADLDGDADLMPLTLALWDQVDKAMSEYDPRAALDAVWTVIKRANRYVEEKKPWALAKDEAKKQELARTLVTLTECVAHVAVLLTAFLPDTAAKMLSRMKMKALVIQNAAEFKKRWIKAGTLIERAEPLFPKLEEVGQE